MEIDIRKATLNDVTAIVQLCFDTIRNSCKKEYTSKQLEAWISAVKCHKWTDSIKKHYFLVAELEGGLVGFGSIEQGEYIGYLYVSSKHLRKGIANRIFENLMKESERMGKTTVWSNVSKTAKPFFESRGFSTAKINVNLLSSVEIENYKMIKKS